MAVRLHPDELQPAIGRDDLLRQYRDLALDTKRQSERQFGTYYRALQRWYDVYRSFLRVTRGYRGWNNIPVPFLFSIVMSDMAKKIDILTGEDPFLQFLPTGPEDEMLAVKMEKLIQAQLLQARLRLKSPRLIQTADLFGHAVWKMGWKTTYGSTFVRSKNRLGGVSVKEVKNRQTGFMGVSFNGPDFDVLDNSDFYPFPGYLDISDMPRVGERYFMDFEDIVVGSEHGPDGEEPMYFPDQVAAMRYSGAARGSTDAISVRRNAAAGGIDDRTFNALTTYDKPVEMLDVVGRVPRGMAIEDPETGETVNQVIITVADNRWCVAVSPIWTRTRNKPYGSFHPIPDPRWFHSPGKIEIGERLQYAINKKVSRIYDALDVWIDPPVLFDENSGFDPLKLMTGPGAHIPMDGNVNDDFVRQLQPDMRGMQLGFSEVEVLWRWLQQTLGLSEDIAIGGQAKSGSRETAHSVERRARAVETRQAMEIAQAEVGWFEPMAQGFVEMDRMWLPLPVELQLIGAHSSFDPVTGRFPTPTLRAQDPANSLSLDEINVELNVRALGATRRLTALSEMQGIQSFVGTIGPLLPALNLIAFVRQILPKFGFRNVDTLMRTEEQMLKAFELQAEAAARGSGGSNGSENGRTFSPEENAAVQGIVTSTL